MSRRPIHPAAWWVWAGGLAVAASRTTNPLVLGLIVGVAATVVAACRTDAPWARAFRSSLWLGLAVVVVRVVAYVLVGSRTGSTVLVTLPELGLGEWAAGIRIGGPVTLEGLHAAVTDGLRLATVIVCLGAANSLADARRLLRCVPTSLHEIGTAVVVTLSIAPQLVESVDRVRRARTLRAGRTTGRRAVRAIAVPVLADALDRSLALAASMDVRGYGRSGGTDERTRRITGALVVGGLLGVVVGTYGSLDGTTPPALGLPLLLCGTAVAAAGLLSARGRVRPTAHRPDRWDLRAWATSASGVVAAVATAVAARVDPDLLVPPSDPPTWPALPLLATLGILVALLPVALDTSVRRAAAAVRPVSGTTVDLRRPARPDPRAELRPGLARRIEPEVVR